jgi:hypothetical protein
MTTRSALRYPVLILCTTGMTTCVPGSESEEPGEASEPAAATASGPASDSTIACFVAEQSVLARAANANTPGPADLRGWIRLKQFGVTDSAGATLMDSDGFALDAAWQRTGADSFVVAGFNDFVRVEIRLRETESGARGMLRAFSDAALERDSSGKLREFRRTSRIHLSWRLAKARQPQPVGLRSTSWPMARRGRASVDRRHCSEGQGSVRSSWIRSTPGKRSTPPGWARPGSGAGSD